jgi:SAM-dependent methyltransferase
MHPNAYTTLAAIEPVGWYYQARIRCLHQLIERFVAPGPARLEILDVGCGTGGTSNSLRRFGHVTGLESSPAAIALLKAHYQDLDVVQGEVDDIPVLLGSTSFDLATIMGVLYHRNVTDPAAALRQISHALTPDGWIVWNESVYPILARRHDQFCEAGRRFRPWEMRMLLEAEGFTVRFGSHLLGWGFPIALALAMLNRASKLVIRSHQSDDHVSDDRPLPPFLNAMLREFTYLEFACSLRGLKMPFGVSYLVIAQKSVR